MPKSFIENYTKQELKNIVDNSKSMTEVAMKIGYASYSASTQNIIAKTFKKYEIPMIENYHPGKRTDSEVFVKDSKVSQSCLRRHFAKIHPPTRCEICGMKSEWNGKPLTLILDHIDGDHHNNEIINLRWVCPNCNSQLETTGFHAYRMSNIKEKCKYKSQNQLRISVFL